MRISILSILVICSLASSGAVAAEAAIDAGAERALAAREGSQEEMVYYVWRTGDGRVVPSARGFAEARATLDVVWPNPGTYEPTWRAVGLSGWRSERRSAAPVRVRGTAADFARKTPEGAEARAAGRSIDVAVGEDGALDWNGVRLSNAFAPSSLTLDLGRARAVRWLVLRPEAGAPFPSHFRIQSAHSTEGPWHPVMSAVFPFFPDPGGREVWIPLRGLVAGALRVLVPRGEAGDAEGARWHLAGAEAVLGDSPPFGPGGGERETAFWNNLWLNFGIAANEVHQRFDPWWETDRPLDGGMVCIGSCEWLAWGAKKLSWLGDHPQARNLEDYIAGNPVGEDGLVWAGRDSPRHLGHSVHHVNNAIYPTAVARHYLMQRDDAFLRKQDPKTGETILSKARRALAYLIDDLGGRDGSVVLPGASHDGTADSKGSNYWDFWLFGHKSAYMDAYFYEALRLFAELEEALGRSERARELRAVRARVKAAFNDAFWNEETGRYVGWIDANGEARDYGFTFVNAIALAVGLAPPERAESVLQWLEGERVVPGDDATGEAIYAFDFAPRSNTVDARRGDPAPINTWGGAMDVSPGGSAAYGKQIQNGGAIFYVSYYGLRARLRYRGADAALARASAIEREFHEDHLRRDPANDEGVSGIFGILREFPESGLVPYFFVDGFVGVRPVAGGLRIAPSLPSEWPSAEAREVHFAGRAYAIRAERGREQPAVNDAEIAVPASGAWLLTPEGELIDADRAR